MPRGLLRSRRSRGVPGVGFPVPPGAAGVGREVVDPVGLPMRGAEVTVTAMHSHEVVVRGTTDPYGLFFAALPPGRYARGSRPTA